MGKKLYIGNLPFSVTKQSLHTIFENCGTVDTLDMITDPQTGRSKGFAFAEMSNDEEAQAAIKKLDGSSFEGRNLIVNEARPRADRGTTKKFESRKW